MTRLVLLSVFAAGCVSQQDASSVAVRVLNAVPDGGRLNIFLDGTLQFAGMDYGSATPYFTAPAGSLAVRIDELLPSNADPGTRTIYDQSSSLEANAESTLVMVGSAAGNGGEFLDIRTTTRGVPTGNTRLQFVHAAPGATPVDVYVTAPDATITAAAPLANSLAYRSVTSQQDVTGGSAQIVLTSPGDPTTVLFASGPLFLTLEGTLLVAILQNNGLDTATRPFFLSILTGAGSGVLLDSNTQASLRFVNASSGTYSLDAFLNSTSVDDNARQVCDPGTTEDGTTLELCAAAFGSISPYSSFTPGSYDVKLQVTGNDAIPAQAFAGGFAAAAASTLVSIGLVPDGATAMQLGLANLPGGRRIATAGQLRILDASVAADVAIEGDPTTDRLEIYVTAPGAALADESADYFGFGSGFDTGYLSLVPGDYQLTLAKTDTAATDPVPEVLFTQQLSLAGGGLYTLVIADSVGAVQPLQSFSIEDDPTP